MNAVFDKIVKDVISKIEKALGDMALVGVCDEDRLQFKIAAEENLDETNGIGK